MRGRGQTVGGFAKHLVRCQTENEQSKHGVKVVLQGATLNGVAGAWKLDKVDESAQHQLKNVQDQEGKSNSLV